MTSLLSPHATHDEDYELEPLPLPVSSTISRQQHSGNLEDQPPNASTNTSTTAEAEEPTHDPFPPASSTTPADSFPEGGARAWLVVFGASAVICATFGLSASAGIFQNQWATNQLKQYSPTAVGWIVAINVFLNLFLGVQVGPLFDRYGPRWILITGSAGYVVSLFMTAQCKEYWEFFLAYGVLAGVTGAMLTTSAIAVVAHWFERKRGRASGIAIMGSSIGGTAFPLMLKPLLDRLGWVGAMRVVGGIVCVLVVVGNLCIRGRLPTGKRGGAIDLKCFRDARFVWATVGISCFEFVLFGVLGLLPTYAIFQGFSAQTSFNVIATLNAGSAFGRLTAGHASDHLGRFNVTLLTLLLTLIVVFALWLPITPHNLPLLYIFAPAFGFGSGSIISLAPVCFGQLCKADQYGQYYGTSYSVVSFATLVCVPIGGALLPAIGAEGFVAVFGAMCVLSLFSFFMARWACLDYRWDWKTVI